MQSDSGNWSRLTEDVPRDLALLTVLREAAGAMSLPNLKDGVRPAVRPTRWPDDADTWRAWWRYLVVSRGYARRPLGTSEQDLATLRSEATQQQLDTAALSRQQCVVRLSAAQPMLSGLLTPAAREILNGAHLDVVDTGAGGDFGYAAGNGSYIVSLSVRLDVEKLGQLLRI